MKRVILVSMFFLIFTSFVHLNAQWAKTYGGINIDKANSVQETSDEGYIVLGYTYSFGAGATDIWILKLSPNGDIEWQKTYGGSDEDYSARSIQETRNGGYIVVGNTKSFGAGIRDIWVLKLSSNGDIEWQKTYGGIDNDYATTIQETSDGGYIVAGTTSSFGKVFGDIWILKLFSNGDIEWQKTNGGSDSYGVSSIQETSDGGYIVVGVPGSLLTLQRIYILKLSSDGDIEWQKMYGEIAHESPNPVKAVQETIDGGYIIAGYIAYGEAVGRKNDAWVLKLDSNGNIEWLYTYGGSGSDSANSVRQTSDGGYIVAGGTNSFGAGSGAWILKLSSNGDIEWQKTYGGIYGGAASSIQETSDGGYIVAAKTSFGAGFSDIWILKLSSNGDIPPCCGFQGGSNASITDTSVSPVDTDTNITLLNTYVTPLDTICSTQDTDAITNLLCPKCTLTISASSSGTTDPWPGNYTYDPGTEVTIKATPYGGYEFSNWSGDASGTSNPITITIDSDKFITANFTKEEEEKKGPCFIATAAYGSPLHPHLDTLRDFRDTYLMPSKLGSKLVRLYYKYSPSVADFIMKHKVLKAAVRFSLTPVIVFSYSMLHFGLVFTTFMFLFIFLLPIPLILFCLRRMRRV